MTFYQRVGAFFNFWRNVFVVKADILIWHIDRRHGTNVLFFWHQTVLDTCQHNVVCDGMVSVMETALHGSPTVYHRNYWHTLILSLITLTCSFYLYMWQGHLHLTLFVSKVRQGCTIVGSIPIFSTLIQATNQQCLFI